MPKRLRAWIKESQFLATTLSIILTFGTADLVDRCQRAKDRKMSAMMVLSSIDNFSTNVDEMAVDMARCDSIGTWLRSLPKDDLDKIEPQEVRGILNEMFSLINFMSHDKTAENIFSNSFETWKNMGNSNYLFIDNVGDCFSRMNADENNWNEWVSDYEATVSKVIAKIQPGEHTLTKLLNDNSFRQKTEDFHVRKAWLDYVAANVRYLNRKNMELMGIDPEEVTAFASERSRQLTLDTPAPAQSDFRTDTLKPSNLNTLRPLIQHIDSIINAPQSNNTKKR
ncbi:MAG: hypothetical protein IJK93_05075 [Muribaculaceae bacterium]|nr:hypothetical protein [Muribaculaceae bacterium]